MAKVRVRGIYALTDPETGVTVVPRAEDYYDTSDSIVKQHGWAFATDDELQEAQAAGPVESVIVEAATAAPGEKRATRRK